MAFDERETGRRTGQPVELYEFAHGPNLYTYTSGQAPVEFDGKTFTPQTISRGSVDATNEVARAGLTITCTKDLPLLDLFNPVPPSDVITLVIRRIHRGDDEAVVLWMGRILSTGFNGGVQAQIRCESVYTSIKRPGLRRLYQRQCPRVLYSCGVDREDFKVTREVDAIVGLAITLDTLSGFAAGYFAGGYVEWSPEPGVVERRAIRSQVGAIIWVNFQAAGLQVGDSVDIFPGCDHTLAMCDAKFSNSLEYGGMPFIPSKNPFDGTPVF